MRYNELKDFVKTGAAIRYRVRLQPAGGKGDKVFPATYKDAKYAEENRIIDGARIPCVHLDSVQSQANRMELALLEAAREGLIVLPMIVVDFESYDNDLRDLGKITCLEAPHRLADAILRDSKKDGKRFRESPEGKILDYASLQNATDLFKISPSSLLFGIWDSTGPKGGLGVKIQRSIVSELVAVDVEKGVRSSSRIDPLAIQREAGPVYAIGKNKGEWTLDAKGADVNSLQKIGKDGNPSEVNHGNIPPTLDDPNGGVTFDYAQQISVISMPSLRRLRFPTDNKVKEKEINLAAQTTLAALGICALVLMNDKGYDLRSRCLLVPEKPGSWERISNTGSSETFVIDSKTALQLLKESISTAESVGLKWRKEPVVLKPSDGLAQLVKRSRELIQLKGE